MEKKKKIKAAAKCEYTEQMMPHNRAQLFKDIFKQNWRILFLEGLLILLSLLPALALLFFKDFYIASLENQFNLGNITEDVLKGSSKVGDIIFSFSSCATLFIFAIVMSGISNVNRYLCTGEPTSFRLDFNDGVKKNIKVNIVYTLIYSVLLMIGFFIRSFIVNGLGAFIFLGLVQAVYFPILLLIYYTNTVYAWKGRDYIFNNTLVYIKYFFIVFPLSLIVTLLCILLFIKIGNSYVWRYALFALIIFLFSPIICLFYNLCFNYIFDKAINKKNYPELVDKGIVRIKVKKDEKEK